MKYISPKKHIHKTSVDLQIDNYAKVEKPDQSDLNRVIVAASVQSKIDAYRKDCRKMDEQSLMDEPHKSDRLGEFLGCRPHKKCHAHAIVAGAHPRSAAARAILAWYELRIDDPVNGCWLPENTAALNVMPKWLKKAVPHSRIHRNGYYFWLDTVINLTAIKSKDDLETALSDAATRLQASTFPTYVMLTAAELKRMGMA